MIEGSRDKLILKTGIWMSWDTPSWSASKAYRHRTAEIEERKELEAEDEHVRNWLAEWNANKQSIYQAVPGLPVAVEWFKGKKS